MADIDTFRLGAPVKSQSDEGTLASQYTNWLTGEIKDAAESIAYAWWKAQGGNPTDISQAKEIQTSLENGSFSLSDLFNVANGKAEFTAVAGTPDPKLIVGDNVINLNDFLSGEQTVDWVSGTGKNIIHHGREFLDTFTSDTPPEGWDVAPPANHDPVAEAWTVNATETDTKLYDKAFGDILKIDLLDGAHVSDQDGDTLTISDILVDGQPLPSYFTLEQDGHTLIVDLNSPDLDPILKDAIEHDSITYTIEDGNGGSTTNTVTLDITGTADHYTGEILQTFTKDAVAVGSGQQPDQTFHFSLQPVEDGFDYSGAVTLTVQGDMDAKNENALVVDGGELVDMFPSDPGLLFLSGTGNHGGPSSVDTEGHDGYPADNVTVSGSSDVVTTGFDDGAVQFDVTVSGQVGNGSDISATLAYDYWM
jgi:hypothetical protein